eukprot:TRINITY_DN76607_c0_g1_i1.p1 TRINITY_DN76607_c0_g1~~TRINITY_DN76607_c0_g1_i1.p1  ORF type:complete len:340 (+),score=70.75 TRINITY_DN76607_c0_g1_i1:58-1020(+)
MSRHSKHSNDRMFFTAKERAGAGFATSKKEVMGTDCFLPFGHCALTLKAPKDAVVTPQGYIYDRAAIVECLLQQKVDAQAQQKKFEEQERKKDRKQRMAEQEVELKQLEEFTQAETGLLSQDHRHKRALERSADKPVDGVVPDKKLRKGELLDWDKAQHRSASFWAKENTQTAAPTEVKKADLVTRCPMTGKKLKMKDLLTVTFEAADQKLIDQGGGKGMYCCAVSKDPIIYQQALFLKPSGVVITEKVYNDIVKKDMICPVSGKKLKGDEDIIKLQTGGTGFSAHNETTASSFSMIRSRAGDDRTQAGHLPKAGYVGLH